MKTFFLIVVAGLCKPGITGWMDGHQYASWKCGNKVMSTISDTIEGAYKISKSTPSAHIIAMDCECSTRQMSNLCMGDCSHDYTSCSLRPVNLSTTTVTQIKYVEESTQ